MPLLAIAGFVVARPYGATAGTTSLTKTADAATVNAGQPIGFGLTLIRDSTKVGFINDPLPGGAGVSWSIDQESQPHACNISGSVPNQQLSCSFQPTIASTNSVHVVSGTTSQSCGTYDNTAEGGAQGDPPVQGHDTTSVVCTQTASPSPSPTSSLTPTPTPTATPLLSTSATATPKPPDVTADIDNGGITITYNPGDEASVCDKIVLVQAVRNTVEKKGDNTKKKTGVKPSDINVAGGATKDGWMTGDGWYVDSATTEYDPYYNGWDSPDDFVDDKGNQAPDNHQGKKTDGGATEKSTMNDAPTAWSNGAFKAAGKTLFGAEGDADKVTYEFIDLIFCAEGTDKGHCFGWYTWTWSQEKGKKPVITKGASHSGSNADAVAALNKWKDKHPKNDVPAVDCG